MTTVAAGSSPAPTLVWDRIDDNERSTRRLLTAFALVLIPFVLSLMPLSTFGVYYVAPLFVGDIDSVSWMQLSAGAFLAMFAIGCIIGYSQYCSASRTILAGVGARPIEDREPELRRAVENLCIGAGLPVPAIHVIETAAPNALTTGFDPARAQLAVTRGLLELLNGRELRAVIAHELSHIGNRDVRLGSTLAASMKVLRLPMAAFELVTGVYAALINERETRLAGMFQRLEIYIGFGITVAALVVAATMLVQLVTIAGRVALHGDVIEALRGGMAADLSTRLFVMMTAAAPAFLVWAARILAWTIDRSLLRTRELLADADAFSLTGDAEALACALVKIDAVGLTTAGSDGTNAHLFLADPIPRAARWWNAPVAAHPPVAERVAALRSMAAFPPAALERARIAAKQWATTHLDASAIAAPQASAANDRDLLAFLKLLPVALVLLVPLHAALYSSDRQLRWDARTAVSVALVCGGLEYVRRRVGSRR